MPAAHTLRQRREVTAITGATAVESGAHKCCWVEQPTRALILFPLTNCIGRRPPSTGGKLWELSARLQGVGEGWPRGGRLAEALPAWLDQDGLDLDPARILSLKSLGTAVRCLVEEWMEEEVSGAVGRATLFTTGTAPSDQPRQQAAMMMAMAGMTPDK